MGALFSKKKPPSRVTEQDKTILQLKTQRDKLKQYQKRIELNLEKERDLAKKLLKDGKKERAKLLLRKKRYQEQLLHNTDAQLDHLERMVHDIEFTQIEVQVLEGLKDGNVALKKMNDFLNIDEVERILEETREGIEKQQEIGDLLRGALTAEDEEAVEEEYQQIIGEALPSVPEDETSEELQLPDIPSTEPEQRKKEKEKQKLAMETS